MRERDHWWAFIQGLPESEWKRSTKPARSVKLSSMRGFPDDPESRSNSPAESERRVFVISSEEIAELESSQDNGLSLMTQPREPTPSLLSLIDDVN